MVWGGGGIWESTSYFNEHKTIIGGFHRFHSVARTVRGLARGSNIVEVLLRNVPLNSYFLIIDNVVERK